MYTSRRLTCGRAAAPRRRWAPRGSRSAPTCTWRRVSRPARRTVTMCSPTSSRMSSSRGPVKPQTSTPAGAANRSRPTPTRWRPGQRRRRRCRHRLPLCRHRGDGRTALRSALPPDLARRRACGVRLHPGRDRRDLRGELGARPLPGPSGPRQRDSRLEVGQGRRVREAPHRVRARRFQGACQSVLEQALLELRHHGQLRRLPQRDRLRRLSVLRAHGQPRRQTRRPTR